MFLISRFQLSFGLQKSQRSFGHVPLRQKLAKMKIHHRSLSVMRRSFLQQMLKLMLMRFQRQTQKHCQKHFERRCWKLIQMRCQKLTQMRFLMKKKRRRR